MEKSFPMAAHGSAYRPDIDGLRAFAVLAVVIFHASPKSLSGGFVGVDVFFVISGYLISRIIFQGLAEGSFSFVDFYRRRVLRIFPALVLVLLVAWGLGWLVLLADEYRELGKHMAAGAGFVSNFALWSESGYFDKAAESKPLLHLWSLGIEEQFYLLWPLLLVFFWRFRQGLPLLIAGIILLSFGTNVAILDHHASAAFYMPFTRFWELLMGGAVAYVELFHRERVRACATRWLRVKGAESDFIRLRTPLSLLGLVLLITATVVVNKSGLYPGAWALLPTLGAVCLIAAGQDAWVNRRVLSLRFLVFVGLISYPLYLWHWPLLSFARIVESGKAPGGMRAAAVLLSLLFAYLSYRFIEKPVRFGRWPYRAVAVLGLMVSVLGAGLFVHLSRDHTSLNPDFLAKTGGTIASPRDDAACKAVYPVKGAYCQESDGEGPVTTAIIGDSHANHLMPGVGRALAARGERAVHLGEPGCPPLLGGVRVRPGIAEDCRQVNDSVLPFLASSEGIRRVIISFRGPLNVSGTGFGEIEKHLKVGYRDFNDDTLAAPQAVEAALARTVQLLTSRGKEVWLFLQVPELGFHIDQCLVRPMSLHRKKREICAVPVSEVVERQREYRAIVARIKARFPRLNVFDPLPYLCDDRHCHGTTGDTVLYIDGDHLSQEGSLFFSDKLKF